MAGLWKHAAAGSHMTERGCTLPRYSCFLPHNVFIPLSVSDKLSKAWLGNSNTPHITSALWYILHHLRITFSSIIYITRPPETQRDKINFLYSVPLDSKSPSSTDHHPHPQSMIIHRHPLTGCAHSNDTRIAHLATHEMATLSTAIRLKDLKAKQ